MRYIFVTLVFVGCTLHLVGKYDQTIDTGISAFQRNCDSYFSGRADSSVAFSQVFYDGVNADLQTLTTRARGIAFDSATVDMFERLQHEIQGADSLEIRVHQRGEDPPPAFFKHTSHTIDQGCSEALTLELAKKRQ